MQLENTTPLKERSLKANRSTHIEFLKKKVFQIDTKWPHYKRLVDDTLELAQEIKPSQKVVCLERAYVYSGISIFAPFFEGCDLTVVDCLLGTADEREGYQRHWLDETQCLMQQSDIRCPIEKIEIADASVDYVYVPNLVHHVKDQSGFFREIARILKPGGKGYIFEPLLRELHQMPDDYLRYTPSGMESALNCQSLKLNEHRLAGGPFEAIAYCWVQALQFLPPELREEKEKWFNEVHFPELKALDAQYSTNLVRQHTQFPVAIGYFFEK